VHVKRSPLHARRACLANELSDSLVRRHQRCHKPQQLGRRRPWRRRRNTRTLAQLQFTSGSCKTRAASSLLKGTPKNHAKPAAPHRESGIPKFASYLNLRSLAHLLIFWGRELEVAAQTSWSPVDPPLASDIRHRRI